MVPPLCNRARECPLRTPLHAGTLERDGTTTVVAVKVVKLRGCSPAQVAAAQAEAAQMRKIAQHLGSCVVRLQGLEQASGQRWLIAMDPARRSLWSVIDAAGFGTAPTIVVRSALSRVCDLTRST